MYKQNISLSYKVNIAISTKQQKKVAIGYEFSLATLVILS